MLHALLLLACTQPEPLTGKVVDIWNNPIEGATVIANGERPLTDDNGMYRMTPFTGETEFKAGKEGYVQDSVTATPTAEDPRGPIFKLYKKPESNGFYAITVGDYLPIEPSTVKLIGHAGDCDLRHPAAAGLAVRRGRHAQVRLPDRPVAVAAEEARARAPSTQVRREHHDGQCGRRPGDGGRGQPLGR